MIEKQGVAARIMKADITEAGMPQKIIKLCKDTYGTVDILVNNAGINCLNPVLKFDRNNWDPMIAVNLTASYTFGKKFVLHQSGSLTFCLQ